MSSDLARTTQLIIDLAAEVIHQAERAEQAEAQLAQLREAAQRWLDHPDQRAHDGHVIESGDRCAVCDLRAALQENPDE